MIIEILVRVLFKNRWLVEVHTKQMIFETNINCLDKLAWTILTRKKEKNFGILFSGPPNDWGT